jgi:hypothetical protein
MSRFSDDLFGVNSDGRDRDALYERYDAFVAARKVGEFDVWCLRGGDSRIGSENGFQEAHPTCYYRMVAHPKIFESYGLLEAIGSNVYRCSGFADRAAAFAFWLRHGEFIFAIEGEGF